jgi:NADPH-dependent 2,4-dienoyl-CoA reductase/sulfur reductase-like enzyme
VQLILNANVTLISESDDTLPGLVYVEGYDSIPADLVIAVTGVRARTAIAQAADIQVGQNGVIVNEKMETTDPDIYAVGDMVEAHHALVGQSVHVPLTGPASKQGRIAADNICGRESSYGGNTGTSIYRIFGLTVGMVGLSNKALSNLGIAFEYITIHPLQHAVYYPGASAMTIQASFQIPSGKILGAQIIGHDGVDKRIDVPATAIQAGLTMLLMLRSMQPDWHTLSITIGQAVHALDVKKVWTLDCVAYMPST